MLSRLARRFSMTSIKFFLCLMGASVIFLYLVSPTIDLAFSQFWVPNGVLPFWWPEDVFRDHRALVAFILVGQLASLIRSTKFFLLLTGASAIFVYLVSPTIDPAFRPNGYNAGSPVGWLKGVHEDDWKLVAVILAALLAINFTLKLWQWYKSQTIFAAHRHREGIPLMHFVIGVMHFVIGIWMWLILSYVFIFYLLVQWLID